MAEKVKNSGGTTAPTGGLVLNLKNPPKAAETGAEYQETWARVELAEGKLTTRIFGRATYDAPTGEVDAAGNPVLEQRDCIHHIDVEDEGLELFRGPLEQLVAIYEAALRGDVMNHAYKARDVAHRIDRPGYKKEK